MGKIIDLTGQRFGRLTVLEIDCMPHKGHSRWICVCDCGEYVSVPSDCLRLGKSKSCGCLYRETIRTAGQKHGLRHTRLYQTWRSMKDRCYNPNNKWYKDYGGRGIYVCEEWRNDVKAFYDWAIANGYRDDLTIDRINVDGNYEPSNCRWADKKTQSNNRRACRFITAFGQTKTMKEWAEFVGISYNSLRWRLNHGYSPEDALTKILGCSNDDLFNDAGNGGE